MKIRTDNRIRVTNSHGLGKEGWFDYKADENRVYIHGDTRYWDLAVWLKNADVAMAAGCDIEAPANIVTALFLADHPLRK